MSFNKDDYKILLYIDYYILLVDILLVDFTVHRLLYIVSRYIDYYILLVDGHFFHEVMVIFFAFVYD